MAKVCVSDAFCSSIPQVALPCHGLNARKCMQASLIVFASTSPRLRVAKHRTTLTQDPSSDFNWMATVGGSGDYFTPVPTSVPVRVARELLLGGHRFLDVRTPEEFSTGHAVEAINVPYLFKVGTGTTKNLNFLEEVLLHFGKDDEIIVGCQSGKRSETAATELIYAGFTGITNIAGGFASWAENGFPIEC